MTDPLLDQLQATLGDAYRIERELGGGGMGRVFLAEETTLGRKVVVKVLPPELGRSLSAERFKREIQLAAKLQHPHIVPLLAAGAAPDGMLYYTMPFIEGDSLRRRLTRAGELPIPEALRILRQVVDALAYAHARGVVHRDIKPDNVLLSGNHAVVTDFGVSKALSTATGPSSLTSLGVALGTPSYMAPEQAAADPNTDHRADIYAVGILAYELLMGHPPFQGSSSQQVLAAHATVAPPRMIPLRPSVPQQLEDLVMACLEKHAADRPQTAEEVLQRLETLSTPTYGSTPAPMEPAMPLKSGRDRFPIGKAIAIGTAAGVIALAAFGASWLRRDTASVDLTETRVLVAGFENRTGDPALDQVGRMASDWIGRMAVDQASLEVVGTEASVREMSETQIISAARAEGAATAVHGTYYKVGDSLQFQVAIFDAVERRPLRTLGPFTAAVAAPTAGIEAMGQRMSGALAFLTRASLGRDIASTVPRFEAYREYLRGDDLYGSDSRAATEHFYRAYAMDPAFTWALVRAAYAWFNMGNCKVTDSIGTVLISARTRMAVTEEAYLNRVLAWCRGDWGGAYSAAVRMRQAAPQSSEAISVAGRAALTVNRPKEAVEIYRSIRRLANGATYSSEYGQALHLVGDHRSELTNARAGVREDPASAWSLAVEARALLALGRNEEAVAAIERGEGLGGVTAYGVLLLDTASDFAYHGDRENSRRLFERAAAWYDAVPQARKTWADRNGSVIALAYAGRATDAVAAGRALVRQFPDSLWARVTFGIAAARAGELTLADSADRWLASYDRPYLLGVNTAARARIAAARGDYSRSVALMRQAIGEGYRLEPIELHLDLEFVQLRGKAGFDELVRPRG